MKYYNLDRLHTANDDRSPIEYEIYYRESQVGWSVDRNLTKMCPVLVDQYNKQGTLLYGHSPTPWLACKRNK